MSDSDGISRLRKAADNQASLGEATFMLPIGEVLAMLDEVEAELARLAWAQGVPAPVDADGKVVPLTTKVMYDDDGEECRIDGFRLVLDLGTSSTWRAGYVVVGFDTDGYVKDLHLRRPDSWELLEEDTRNTETGGACGYYGRETKPCNEDCPAHKDLKTPCSAIVLKDALRRAKALAEVS